MLITGLPEYYDGCYKMEDVVQLLVPFGFKYGDNNIYIVPQIRMVKKIYRMIIKNKNWNLENVMAALLGLCVLCLRLLSKCQQWSLCTT